MGLLLLAAGALAPVLAGSASAGSRAAQAAAEQTYTDPAGDANGFPDVVKVTTSDDADGTLHWTVSYDGGGCVGGDDSLDVGIDSDLNTDTGLSGIDYLLVVSSSGASLLHWETGGFQTVGSSTLESSCGASGDRVQINRSEVGVDGQLDFVVLTDEGAGDEAPDSGYYTYTVGAGGSPPPPPPPAPPPPPTPPPPPAPGAPAGVDATFGADAPPHYAHWRVRFDGVTFGAASYDWQFGDGTSTQTKAPLAFHRYSQPGTFTVTLVVTDGAGATGQSTTQVDVLPLPAAERLPTIAGRSPRSRREPAYSRAAAKEAGGSRTVACWNAADWAILAKAFDDSATGAYVDPAKPRQIGLAPSICSRLDLIRYRKPRPPAATGTAVAVLAFARAIMLSRGYVDKRQATCYALQTVPDTAALLGADTAYADRLGLLAAKWYGPKTLPRGSWSPQCRDGGKLDLDPAARHWP